MLRPVSSTTVTLLGTTGREAPLSDPLPGAHPFYSQNRRESQQRVKRPRPTAVKTAHHNTQLIVAWSRERQASGEEESFKWDSPLSLDATSHIVCLVSPVCRAGSPAAIPLSYRHSTLSGGPGGVMATRTTNDEVAPVCFTSSRSYGARSSHSAQSGVNAK